MKIGAETITSSAVESGASSVRIKLIANPLENNERPTVDICAGFDDEDGYLQTIDGLPLVTVTKRQDAKSVSLAAGRDNKSVIVFLSNGTNVRQLEVSGSTKMMGVERD